MGIDRYFQYPEALSSYLAKGNDPNEQVGGLPALAYAATLGFRQAVPVLLDAGASIDATAAKGQDKGRTALRKALDGDKLEIASDLLDRGARVSAGKFSALNWALVHEGALAERIEGAGRDEGAVFGGKQGAKMISPRAILQAVVDAKALPADVIDQERRYPEKFVSEAEKMQKALLRLGATFPATAGPLPEYPFWSTLAILLHLADLPEGPVVAKAKSRLVATFEDAPILLQAPQVHAFEPALHPTGIGTGPFMLVARQGVHWIIVKQGSVIAFDAEEIGDNIVFRLGKEDALLAALAKPRRN